MVVSIASIAVVLVFLAALLMLSITAYKFYLRFWFTYLIMSLSTAGIIALVCALIFLLI